jgi:hypothetical protein
MSSQCFTTLSLAVTGNSEEQFSHECERSTVITGLADVNAAYLP